MTHNSYSHESIYLLQEKIKYFWIFSYAIPTRPCFLCPILYREKYPDVHPSFSPSILPSFLASFYPSFHPFPPPHWPSRPQICPPSPQSASIRLVPALNSAIQPQFSNKPSASNLPSRLQICPLDLQLALQALNQLSLTQICQPNLKFAHQVFIPPAKAWNMTPQDVWKFLWCSTGH